KQKPRGGHVSGASRQHTLWPVVPPCLAARSAYEHTRATHSYGHGARTQRPSGLRSMPCPLVTEGCRRRLPATLEAWRSSRVAARRTPTAEPEGGFLTTPDAGLAPSPGSLRPRGVYWSLATTLLRYMKYMRCVGRSSRRPWDV